MTDPRFAGLGFPNPRFADDRGDADPRVATALEAFSAGTGERAAVHEALSDARLLVPVVAVLDEVEVGDDGLAHEKSSHMATVSMIGVGGRRALLAFTSVASMKLWDPQARPVPALGSLAAQAAVDQGEDALLIDVAGPVRFAVTDDALRALAAVDPVN